MSKFSFSLIAPNPESPVLGEWIRVAHLCTGLCIDASTLRRILKRNSFTPDETTFTTDLTAGGEQLVRIFSRHGALKVAMLSSHPRRVEIAMELIKQAKGETRLRLGSPQTGAGEPPVTEAVQILEEIKVLHNRGELTLDVIEEFQRGRRVPPPEEIMSVCVSEWHANQKLDRVVRMRYREIDAKAVRAGYSSGAVKKKARQNRDLHQPELTFDSGEG